MVPPTPNVVVHGDDPRDRVTQDGDVFGGLRDVLVDAVEDVSRRHASPAPLLERDLLDPAEGVAPLIEKENLGGVLVVKHSPQRPPRRLRHM